MAAKWRLWDTETCIGEPASRGAPSGSWSRRHVGADVFGNQPGHFVAASGSYIDIHRFRSMKVRSAATASISGATESAETEEGKSETATPERT